MPLVNIAFAYLHGGRFEEAASTFKDALVDREREYGLNDRTSFVTGKLLLGYGNVKASQGLLDESFALHQRCLLYYKSTVGNNHHRTGDGCVKVSDHYVRLLQFDSAPHRTLTVTYLCVRSLLDQALKIFGDHEHFIPEKARAKIRRAKLFRLMNRTPESEADLRRAFELFRRV